MRSKIFNVPNTLSLIRVFLAPLVLLFLSLKIDSKLIPVLSDVSWGDALAAFVFIIASLTDILECLGSDLKSFFSEVESPLTRVVTQLAGSVEPKKCSTFALVTYNPLSSQAIDERDNAVLIFLLPLMSM